MLISLDWLKRYVDVDISAPEVGDRITQSGFEIDAIEEVSGAAGEASDWRLDVEVTWNRPDCQSHIGIAREVAGLLGRDLCLPTAQVTTTPDPIDVAVEDPVRCPSYTARIIRGVRVGPSPRWLVRCLESVGLRSINNVVDVTNFVLMETGQPLHAFDLARLEGPRLVARTAPAAKMTAIDGKLVTFGADDLAICDGNVPVALAGVMGGASSEVTAATVDIALECALFDPMSVRATSKRHQIRSDSSFRFERFVDPAGADQASDRAAQLLVEICGAVSVGEICRAGPGAVAPSSAVSLRPPQVKRVLGVPVGNDEIQSILVSLGCSLQKVLDDGTQVWQTPSWRPDLSEEIDLIEEVARRVGFDRVPDDVRIPVRPVPVDPLRAALAQVRRAFLDCGLRECVTEPFVGEGIYDVSLDRSDPALRVENPMRAEESLLRRSLVGTLLRVARSNFNRGNRGLRLFEIAPVYLRGDAATETREVLLGAALLPGDFAAAKGCAELILASVGGAGSIVYTKGAAEPFEACRGARLLAGDTVVGHIVELDARSLERYGVQEASSLLELDVGHLCAAARADVTCVPVSRQPAVERDLDVVVDDRVAWAALEACVREGASDLLESIEPFDIFRGDKIGAGKKSITLRMVLRADDRTLTAAEAEERVQRALALITERTGGVLRS